MTIIIAVGIMLALCLVRVNIILSLIIGAVSGGLIAHMPFSAIIDSFSQGVTHAAQIALSYGMLGAFANGLAYSGITEKMAMFFHSDTRDLKSKGKVILVFIILCMGIASQNIIPIHIAFIPIVIPPLLVVFNHLRMDRRLIACVITFGITFTYMTVPIGFGNIYLNSVLGGNLALNDLHASTLQLSGAMLVPASGMIGGLLIAIFFSYRKPRVYNHPMKTLQVGETKEQRKIRPVPLVVAIVATLLVQIFTQSMIMGALAGTFALIVFRLIPRKESDAVFMEGFRIMAPCGFIMMAASGFAAVLQDTGTIPTLVNLVAHSMLGKGMLVFLMLLTGLLITMGIGSSFSTVPIIASIYVPIAVAMGLSPMATIALVGTAGALGDAGSPASDSTIGPTSGLNMDGQHDHIRDTVIPTFIHYNIPLLITGWAGVMML